MEPESNTRKEHPSTYIVQDRSNSDELERLKIQDEMITADMGGVLPEYSDPTRLRRVLDVGCGTGGWLIQLAQAYPSIEFLAGADVSQRMIEYAREQAKAAGVADRVSFHVMDALRMLEFPPKYFDLLNHRLGFSYLRTWDWPNLLQKYQWVTRFNGTIRVTESDAVAVSNSPALNQFYDLLRESYYASGHLFTPDRRSVIQELPGIMHQQGIQQVQTRAIPFHYTAGDKHMESFYNNMGFAMRTVAPFLRKWTKMPEDYENLCKRALNEMQQSDFTVSWEMMTVWGTNEMQNSKPPIVEHH
jgi:ubiquinone/menaquinone biosynthesis C-methylase UbiE